MTTILLSKNFTKLYSNVKLDCLLLKTKSNSNTVSKFLKSITACDITSFHSNQYQNYRSKQKIEFMIKSNKLPTKSLQQSMSRGPTARKKKSITQLVIRDNKESNFFIFNGYNSSEKTGISFYKQFSIGFENSKMLSTRNILSKVRFYI